MWEGDTMYDAAPIRFQPTTPSPQSIRDGLHVLELCAVWMLLEEVDDAHKVEE